MKLATPGSGTLVVTEKLGGLVVSFETCEAGRKVSRVWNPKVGPRKTPGAVSKIGSEALIQDDPHDGLFPMMDR